MPLSLGLLVLSPSEALYAGLIVHCVDVKTLLSKHVTD